MKKNKKKEKSQMSMSYEKRNGRCTPPTTTQNFRDLFMWRHPLICFERDLTCNNNNGLRVYNVMSKSLCVCLLRYLVNRKKLSWNMEGMLVEKFGVRYSNPPKFVQPPRFPLKLSTPFNPHSLHCKKQTLVRGIFFYLHQSANEISFSFNA